VVSHDGGKSRVKGGYPHPASVVSFLSAAPQFPAMPWIDSLNGAQCHGRTHAAQQV